MTDKYLFSPEIKNWLYYPVFIILGIILLYTVSKAGFIVYVLILVVLIADKIIKIVKENK